MMVPVTYMHANGMSITWFDSNTKYDAFQHRLDACNGIQSLSSMSTDSNGPDLKQ